MKKLLSIIVPVYNEETTVFKILDKVKNVKLGHSFSKEILLINDGSSDRSEDVILSFIKENPGIPITYKRLEKNMGKGNAVKQALRSCSGDVIVIQDSDMEYNPEDYNLLLDSLVTENNDVVFGNRFNKKNKRRISAGYYANRGITALSNVLSGQRLNDIETGMKMFRKKVLSEIDLIENRFGFEPEFTLKVSKKRKFKIAEVDIDYNPRGYKQGKKIGISDGVRTVYCLFKYGI
jgi:glycosyltransferase involved in cell wall biosynthesis